MVHLCLSLVSKSAWKMRFVSLLQLWSLCAATTVSLVKIIGEEPDVTPICANQTVDVILSIICRIKTARTGGKECQLLYNFDNGTESSCDFRITLKKKITQNETMFLQLNKLTPADSGSYNCECTFNGGTGFVQLNVTVNSTEKHEVNNTSPMYILIALTSITVIIIGIAVTFAIRQIIHRKKSKTIQSLYQNVRLGKGPAGWDDQQMPADIEPYGIYTQTNNILYSSSLRQTNDMLYSTVQAHTAQTSITC